MYLSASYLLVTLLTDSAICPSSFDQSNGKFVLSDPDNGGRWEEGDTVTVSCDQGYAPIEGNPVSTCGSDGSWMPNVPKCLSEPHTHTHTQPVDCPVE